MSVIDREFIFAVLMIFLIGIVSANIILGNKSHLIDTQYGPSDNIRGWINISLTGEDSQSEFKDGEGSSIYLIDLLNKTNANYNCSVGSCFRDYTLSKPEINKTFILGAYEEKLIGFVINGQLTGVDSIKFSAKSDAGSSCFNQLEFSFFDESFGEIRFGNNKILNDSICNSLKNNGCYDSNSIPDNVQIGYSANKKSCQRVKLNEAPGFEIGAWVDKPKDLVMSLYNLNGEEINGANCKLKDSNISSNFSCSINYLVTNPEEYYVCIYSDKQTSTSIIHGYIPSNKSYACGFNGAELKEIASFDIFAIGKPFDSVGELNITNSLPNNNLLSDKIWEYIRKNYNSDYDCTLGCIIPIRIISKTPQTVYLSDLDLKYSKNLGTIIDNKFIELEETPVKVNMGFQKILLDNLNFSVSSNYGNSTFILYFNGTQILSQKIIIEKVPIIKYITPTETASAVPTEFEIKVESTSNITEYNWDFGDWQTDTTNINKVLHTYNSTNIYTITISVTDSNQRKASRMFDIFVDTPEKAINTTLKKMQIDLANVDAQINGFNGFAQKGLREILNITYIDNQLTSLNLRYKQASGEESEYNSIMRDLLSIKIPESISKTKSVDSMSFFPSKNFINVDILQSIKEGTYDSNDEDEYKDAIIAWNVQNLETKITSMEITARYSNFEIPLLNIFDVEFDKKGDFSHDVYFIIQNLEGLQFKDNYEEKEKLGYTYIKIAELDDNIGLLTTEEIAFTELPLFISPEIDRLVINSENPDADVKKPKWIIFGIIILAVVVVGFGAYLFMQKWYKTKYETHLFKDRNNLYNLVVYIENEREKGTKDNDIKNKLSKIGWNSEQIIYAMKKHSGKNTGMFEIPTGNIVNKFLNIFKKNKPLPVKNTGFNYPTNQQRKF